MLWRLRNVPPRIRQSHRRAAGGEPMRCRAAQPERAGAKPLTSTCLSACTRARVVEGTRGGEQVSPGHKRSSGPFVPGERPGHWPGAACKARAA